MPEFNQPKPADWDDELDGPWDGNFDPADDADIELIVTYLQGRLDPEAAAAVRKRLDEDEHFRYLAEPMLLVWSLPKHLERHPRPEGEWERAFEDFKRRTGFPNRPAEWSDPQPSAPPPSRWHRIRYWRHWKGLRVLILLLVGSFMIGAQLMVNALENPGVEEREFSPVPFDTGWIALNDGIEVQLSPGASLQVDHRRVRNMKHVLLEGTARFRVSPLDSTSPVMTYQALLVETRAGSVTAGESDFTISAVADTTLVHVYPIGARRALDPMNLSVRATAQFENETINILLRDHDGARLVVGRDPERITNNR